MTTLAEHIIIARDENRPPMLEKSMYDTWASRIRLFIKRKKHGRMILDSIDNGPLVYPTVEENGQTKPKKYSELTEAQQLQDDCDVQATNISLHGFPPDVYAIVNHQEAAKDIWDKVKMLMKGTELSYEEHECRLYNLFDKFAYVQGETLYEYYWRFSQQINDMHTIGMTMQQVQVNTKFLNALPSEWSKFVTDVKSAKSLYTTNYDQFLVVPRFQQGKDPIECINKAMTFLSALASRQTQGYAGTRDRGIATTSKGNFTAGQQSVMKCYNCQEEGHMARQCTQPKRPKNAAWFKEILMLAEAQEACQILDEEQLSFLADPGILEALVAQQTIPLNLAFQTEDLDAYDSDCDDLSSAKAVLMANLLSYDPEVLSESQDAVIQDTNSSAPNDLLVLSLVEQMTDHVAHLDKENQTNKMQEIDTLKETISNNVKEKESLSKTFTMYRSTQAMHMLMKPQDFYDDTNKQALGYQILFHLRKAQRIQPTLYDGSVIAKEHVVISMIDDEETLILEEESRSNMLDKQNDPISIEKKIKISPTDYSKLNKIKEDFGKHFVTKKELSIEQAFWLKHSSLFETPVKSHTHVRIEAPSELPKGLGIDNDQLLTKVMSQEIVHIVANFVDSFDVKKSCVNDCSKCLELETGLLKKKDFIKKEAHDKLVKSYSTLEKPQSQEKDTVLRKLKDRIKSLSGKDSLENIKKDIDEIETINIELEHNMAKLLLENENLKKEQELLKSIYKDQFDSIRKTRVQSKEHCDSLIAQINAKSLENSDLIAQLQEKVFANAALKNELRKLKGKNVVDTAVLKPNATIAPRINQKNKVEDHSRKVKSSLNKTNSVSEPVSNALVKRSVRNAKFESICAICNKCLFDANHDMSIIDYVNDGNVHLKSKPKRNKMRKVVQIVLWYLDSGGSKHMTRNRSQLINFVSKFLGTVRFGNDHIAKIMGYGYYQIGNVTISQVYYVEGLDGVDLLKESRGSNIYTLSMDNFFLSSPICLLSKASKTKSWLWHQRLSHLNFDYINSLAKHGLVRGLLKLKYQKDHLCSACALGKSKKHSHKPKAKDSIQEKLYLLHMDLCGLMRVQSINGRKYISVIVDDFSQFTLVKSLCSKDEVLEFVVKFLKMIQVHLNATVRNIRTDNGTEFINQTLRAYYEEVGISHQTLVARTPQ
ncbi:retrovirus-related pol polyprotein from transposon TNT 1-94 [Tanacetum coccineum]